MSFRPSRRIAAFALSAISWIGTPACADVAGQTAAAAPATKSSASQPAKPKLDYSGRKRVGKASFYARKFSGRRMADGNRMNPSDDNAASKTLPLGTRARVTNLETGQSATVTIQDRGPHVKGRIVDLSPATAEQIGLDKADGVAKVEVKPLELPLPDGRVRRTE